MDHIDIVFDGPPGPEAGRFVEVEDSTGASIRVGTWVQREDGYWVLRVPDVRVLIEELTRMYDEHQCCGDPDVAEALRSYKYEGHRPTRLILDELNER